VPPGLQLLLPASLLGAGALLTWLLGAARVRAGRRVVAVAAWAALAALAWAWLRQPAPVEFHGPSLAPGLQFGQRLDALDFALSLALLLPACLLLTFQHRGWEGAGAAALAIALSLTAVLADSLVITALALGAASSVMLVQVRSDSELGMSAFWPAQTAGWLALLWAAAALQVVTGTSAYAAVPVGSAPPELFGLVLLGALLCASVLPWRGWTSEFWDRPRLLTGSLAAAVLVPAGFLVLFRAYEVGGGRWPASGLNVAVAVAGAAAVVGAALRAQAASTRRRVHGESIVGISGFAVVGVALGTPLGLIAGVTCVLAAGLLSALLPLLPDDRSATSLAGSVLAAGLPPGLAFAGRLLTVEAGIEAGTAAAFLAVLLALAWLLELAAAARGVRLPAAAPGALRGGSLSGSLAGLGLLLAGGAGFGVVVARLAAPAAAGLVQFLPNSISGTPLAAVSAAGGWSAAALGIPLVALGLLLLPALRAGVVPVQRGAPEAFLPVGWAAAPRRWLDRLGRARLPEQYESLFRPSALESAMARGQPVLWLVLLLVLAVAVNR
jgi:hypothetical protein